MTIEEAMETIRRVRPFAGMPDEKFREAALLCDYIERVGLGAHASPERGEA